MQTEKSGKGRNQALDALKGAAIIGILFAHMNFLSRFSEATMHFVFSAQLWFGWCVMAFFFSAGLLTPFESIGPPNFKDYILKRSARLLLPCFVFSLTYKTILNVVFHTLGIGASCIVDGRNLFSVLNYLFVPVGPQFYFLPYLFFLSVLAVGLTLLIRNVGLLLCGVSLLCVIFYVNRAIPSYAYGPDLLLLPSYLLNYIAGLACREKLSRQWLPFLFFALCVIVMCSAKHSFFFAYIAAPIVIYLLLTPIKSPNPITFLGRQSGPIYVWHDPLILPFISILASKVFASSYFQLIVIMVGGISISIALGEISKRSSLLKYYRL